MRVALVWYGQMREFPICKPNWMRFINIHKPDIFIHTWSPVDMYELRGIKYKSLLIEEATNLDHLKDGVADYSSSALNVLPQMYSITRADQLRVDHEVIHGIKYDWILRARMDISLHNPGGIQFAQMSPYKIHVARNHWTNVEGMYDDNIMIMGGEYRDISQSLLKRTIDHIHKNRVIPSGEQLLSEYLRFFGHVYKNPDLDFTLGRHV